MGEHTPTPWRVEDYVISIYADSVPKGPMRVADMRGWGYLTGKGHGALGLSDDEALAIQRANAAFIVKAVNNHDALVQALVEIRTYTSDPVATNIAHGVLRKLASTPDLHGEGG